MGSVTICPGKKAAADERREKGITIVGRATIRKQHWNAQPRSREPRRGMSLRIAYKNMWASIEALQRNRAFIRQYRDARNEKLAGRDVVFAARTWSLHRFAGDKHAQPEATAPPVRKHLADHHLVASPGLRCPISPASDGSTTVRALRAGREQ